MKCLVNVPLVDIRKGIQSHKTLAPINTEEYETGSSGNILLN